MSKSLVSVSLVMVLAMIGCGEERASLTVVNGLDDFVITRVYVYAEGSADRGSNLLRDALPPDSSVTVSLQDSLSSVLLFDEDGDSYLFTNVARGGNDSLAVTLDDISTTRFHYGDGPYALNVRNGLEGSCIYYLRISDPAEEEWTDYLQWNTLWPDEVLTAWVEEGSYRVVAEDQDGNAYTSRGISVDSTGASLTVEASDRDTSKIIATYGEGEAAVEIVSRLASWDVVELRFKPLGSPDWSENVIGIDTLDYMESVVIRLSPGTYRIRAMDEDSDSYLLDSLTVGIEEETCYIELNDILVE
ncbi:hypothetical protein GF402_04870 [Candidatus Fermentibacteria bacterium]|nr:hypothetical protein [Candidatus Fermentibacteria bacterium]